MSTSGGMLRAVGQSAWLWGGLAAVGFYAVLLTQTEPGSFLHRYCAGHPVEYIEVGMFFVGLAALVLKWFSLADQRQRLDAPLLESAPAGRWAVEDAPEFLRQVDALPSGLRDTWLARRVRAALEHVARSQSADRLDDQLKYLADMDAARLHDSYAMVRIITWAIPILGFLGTVIGITMALAGLRPEALDDFTALTASLSVAFDTTALALGLTILLMFLQFLTDRAENRLLAEVDHRAETLLSGRFEQYGGSGDPQVAAVRRMAESVLQASRELVQQQAALWQSTVEAAHQHWQNLSTATQQQLRQALDEALGGALDRHAQRLTEAEHRQLDAQRRHWQEVRQSLDAATAATTSQQSELTRQGNILLKVVEATQQVARLEETLNRNLAALAGSQDFSDTLVSLSAAIQLLSARLGQSTAPRVDLKQFAEGQAA